MGLGVIKSQKRIFHSRPRIIVVRQYVRTPATILHASGSGIHYDHDEIYPSRTRGAKTYEGFHFSEDWPIRVKHFLSNIVDVNIRERELTEWLSVDKMNTLDSANIAKLYECILMRREEDGFSPQRIDYYFATERATTNLNGKVRMLTEIAGNHYDKLVGFLRDAANGLKWLHCRDEPIIHRRVKPQNILIFSNNNSEIAKISDFGVSTVSKYRDFSNYEEWWISPEEIVAECKHEEFVYTPSVDIFCFGMTCHYTMSGGTHPFVIKGEFTAGNIRHPSRPPNSLNSENLTVASHLFCQMMQKVETKWMKRPDIIEVLHHPFFFK